MLRHSMSDVLKLRTMRLDGERLHDPRDVLRLSKPIIRSGQIQSLGSEAWDIYEQTIVAALEASDDALAIECLTRLGDKFRESGRVHALRGMVLEATQDPEEAMKFYERVLSVEPSNVPVIKRRIIFSKSLGRIPEAISFLVNYLDTYYTDADAWAELADLYYDLSQFDKAAFCWAEVILIHPADHVAHATYGDCLYAVSVENVSSTYTHLALKEYLRSVELCDDYVRGFCGIKVCCDAILRGKGTNSGKEKTVALQGDQDILGSVSTEKVKALDLLSLRVLGRLASGDLLKETEGSSIAAFVQQISGAKLSIQR